MSLEFSDDQLKTFLARVPTPHLLAYLNAIPKADAERIIGLLSPTSAGYVRRRLLEDTGGQPSVAEAVLEKIAAQREVCVFCEILSGKLHAGFVYRDERIAALMDLFPIAQGHVIIIPIQHAVSLTEINSSVASVMMEKAHELGKAVMQSDLGPDGFNLFLADGSVAHQTVFHAHLHVIPRYHGDGVDLVLHSDYPREAERSDLDAKAEMLRGLLEYRQVSKGQ